ncbi:homoserine O-acetyltransferase [soil metagenome]
MAADGVGRVEMGGGTLRLPEPLPLDSGQILRGCEVAYRTYGTLNDARSNAVIVCHALTGDQHVASPHPASGKPGWWTRMIGPGRPVDTDRLFVICANVIGGCSGSTGPSSVNPGTGRPYGLSFPVITIGDMVRAQAALVEALGVERLFAVIGGSMGGMQALEWARAYPERVESCVVIASAARHTAQNIAFHEVGRQAVMADPDWRGGDYLALGVRPEKGLAVARMAAHITYLSDPALQRKFGRELQADGLSWGFDADLQVEGYLRQQGASFVDRFDANSYLYITRAMDYFDLASSGAGVLSKAFSGARNVRFLIAAFTSDWLYPTAESRTVTRALNAAGARVSFVEIESDKGHDAFLLDEPVLDGAVAGFLSSLG